MNCGFPENHRNKRDYERISSSHLVGNRRRHCVVDREVLQGEDGVVSRNVQHEKWASWLQMDSETRKMVHNQT